MDRWNFFSLCGSAAATLMGLMFVAVSLGSTIIKRDKLDPVDAFISPLCFHFIHVFFLCAMTAVPGPAPALLAAACLGSALW